jgi:hypothetical protein
MIWTEEMTKKVEELTEKIRHLRVALVDINDVVDDSVDIDKNGNPNIAMRVSMIIKEALGEK